ncbi:hypothetical protein [Candidatus Entotheonella palauensis]|uniref:hypothetical protein n=1 Tax=Candidatus Entotheonella palauensis TaxID=93172 RepID=UPI0015C4E60F|nr:hypothetical protein [Candidatus Entotheonella palauensis]
MIAKPKPAPLADGNHHAFIGGGDFVGANLVETRFRHHLFDRKTAKFMIVVSRSSPPHNCLYKPLSEIALLDTIGHSSARIRIEFDPVDAAIDTIEDIP